MAKADLEAYVQTPQGKKAVRRAVQRAVQQGLAGAADFFPEGSAVEGLCRHLAGLPVGPPGVSKKNGS